ncbi:hypothetical protein ACIBCN_03170 [Nocardia sp. NPDC051052]|uniref:hypothetical protein n=1 Tax=Nocardia sp. NPDC051052 TaxID=3364322 RepID=UPI0037A28FF4
MAVPRRLTMLSAVVTCSVALALAAPTAGAAPAPPTTAPVPPGTNQTGTVAPGDLFGVYNTAIDGLRAFGMQPFLYPTAAAYCLNGNSLGLAPAVAGAVPGPWPKTSVTIPGLDLSAVKAGQTMFTFVPYGLNQDGPDTTGMQVAWLNVTSGRGGLASMGPLSTILRAMIPPEVPVALRPIAERAIQDFFFAALPMGGVRAVPVDTGQGTVLAAVFGTVENGGKSCFFLPTVGITEVP